MSWWGHQLACPNFTRDTHLEREQFNCDVCKGQRVIGHGTSSYFGFKPLQDSEARDAARIAETLKLNPDALVEMRCSSPAEADGIRAHLSSEQLEQTRLLWREGKAHGGAGTG